MRVRTATVELDAPRSRVFQYLAEPRNHADWATEFISGMEEEDSELWARTEMGRVRYGTDPDPGTGVVDIVVRPTDGPPARFPARVVAIDEGTSAFLFTMTQPPGMSDAAFESAFASLERELADLRRLFTP